MSLTDKWFQTNKIENSRQLAIPAFRWFHRLIKTVSEIFCYMWAQNLVFDKRPITEFHRSKTKSLTFWVAREGPSDRQCDAVPVSAFLKWIAFSMEMMCALCEISQPSSEMRLRLASENIRCCQCSGIYFSFVKTFAVVQSHERHSSTCCS